MTPHLGPIASRLSLPPPETEDSRLLDEIGSGSLTRADSDLRPMAVIHAEALEANAVLDGDPPEPEWDAGDAAVYWAEADGDPS